MGATSLEWGLAGKSVIVTGASSGIGAATARALGSAGASVLLVGRDEGRLNEQVAKVFTVGGRAVACGDRRPRRLRSRCGPDRPGVKEFGSLHGIVHTASLFDPQPLEETSIECFDRQWKTNELGRS